MQSPLLRLLVLSLLLSGAPLLVARDFLVPGDYQTIQEAIDAASPGDQVIVSPGIYHERIVLKPHLRIRSAGDDSRGVLGLARAESTLIDGGGEEGDVPGVSMAEGSILDGFTITNVGKFEEATWQKHWDEQGRNQSHEHIGGFGTPGIGIEGISCTVVNNIVHHVGSTGIAIRGEEGKRCAPLVSSNICFRNMGGGIGSMQGSTAVIVGNTCFENFYAGIGHDNAAPLVLDNDCHGNIRAGIGISEGASPTVRSNRCHGNRRAGIGIRTGKNTRPLVEDNDCFENAMAGIGVEENAEPVLRSNRCHHNHLAGIGCQEGARAILVENHCFENGASGIGADGAEFLAFENHCEKNQTSGLGVSNDSRAIIVGSRCLENRLVAIGVTKGSDAVIIDTTSSRTGGMPPLLAVQKEATAFVHRSTFEGGGVAAAMVAGNLSLSDSSVKSKGGRNALLVAKEGIAFSKDNQFEGYEKTKTGPGLLRELDAR
ncbi:MAG: right-handed parallel beta-helix repeat-containing protein [Verrucomicrobiae bacterium]|nr:right-handed parallel beta-helix repeat-containing protein [Verrucomicrobiae bacterium]